MLNVFVGAALACAEHETLMGSVMGTGLQQLNKKVLDFVVLPVLFS